ncbi:MAG TPA: hypothetical protein VG101_12175 [Puia sp.]|jgi:hypothetical protein|nr:hypothetical protein [Puia sp.]
MKLMFRNLLIIVIGATVLTAVPVKSHAGIIGDILKIVFNNGNGNGWGYGRNKHDPPPPPPPPPGTTNDPNGWANGGGNSVPLGAGTIFLVVAGLGLGAKLLYSRGVSDVA